jgi:hypothetical protein
MTGCGGWYLEKKDRHPLLACVVQKCIICVVCGEERIDETSWPLGAIMNLTRRHGGGRFSRSPPSCSLASRSSFVVIFSGIHW